jgi:TonB family protein
MKPGPKKGFYMENEDKSGGRLFNAKAKGGLFLQALLLSILCCQVIVLGMSNFVGPVQPFMLQRSVQQLENIEVIKPPSKTIQIPEVKPPPKLVQAAPEISEDEEAAETIDIPTFEHVVVEDTGGSSVFSDLGPIGGDEVGEEERGLVLPEKIYAPDPVYPPMLKEAGWSGTCSIGLYIDESGNIGKVWVIRSTGKPEADQAAIEAAWASQWKPATQNGVPIAKKISITYEYEINVY